MRVLSCPQLAGLTVASAALLTLGIVINQSAQAGTIVVAEPLTQTQRTAAEKVLGPLALPPRQTLSFPQDSIYRAILPRTAGAPSASPTIASP